MIVLGFALGLVFAAISYISCSAIWVSVGVLISTILFFVLFLEKEAKKYSTLYRRFDECYTFINTFLVSLSIKGSLKGALETTTGAMSDDFNKEYASLESMTENEKLLYLSKYFRFHIYHLFCDLFLLWQEQGGDILDMSHYLLNECYLLKDYLLQSKTMANKKIAELTVLWAFSLVILVVLRFALNQFYAVLAGKLFYQVAIFAIFMFVLISIFLMTKKVTTLEVKGWNMNEKD